MEWIAIISIALTVLVITLFLCSQFKIDMLEKRISDLETYIDEKIIPKRKTLLEERKNGKTLCKRQSDRGST